MPTFDPIASPTVRIADHREPAFVFPEHLRTFTTYPPKKVMGLGAG